VFVSELKPIIKRVSIGQKGNGRLCVPITHLDPGLSGKTGSSCCRINSVFLRSLAPLPKSTVARLYCREFKDYCYKAGKIGLDLLPQSIITVFPGH